MSWANILKTNDKEFETSLNIEEEIIEDDIEEHDPRILDVDDEFDNKHAINIYDIKFDFKLFLEEECLPFLDKKFFNGEEHQFYEFIKYNSENYYKLSEKVDQENAEYLKQSENEYEDDELNDEVYHEKI
jgi:hypothetical protein